MHRIDVSERRTRLSLRHRLGQPASDPVEVSRSLVGLHSTDPVSVFLGVRARAPGVTPADIEHALYEARSLARVLGMRRTMFVVPTETVPIVHAAATRALALRERARTVRMIEEGGVARDGRRWLSKACGETLAALEQLGPSAAAELSKAVPALSKQIEVFRDGKLQGTFGTSTRVLFTLATEGRIVRARPRGGWTSTQYRWALTDRWLGTDIDSLPTEPAQAELVGMWLSAFGPGSREDVKWWTGWTVAETKRALEAVGAVEVELDEGVGYVLPDDLKEVAAYEPTARFLPPLDTTIMGWKQRDWYLGAHAPVLFDTNGNAGPTILWDGRVIGGWTQRRDGEIVYRLLEDVGADARRAVEDEASSVGAWLGDVRFIPRFRTPLERELASDPGPA